jgi:cyclomaltodextrinase / maltogenic alpha-amylase / neopullulanase
LLATLFLPALGFADSPAQSADLAAKKTDAGVLFQCSAPGASAVYLAGDFNRWAENTNGVINDAKYQMEGPDVNGIWQKTVTLTPGQHKFKFNIGGTLQGWLAPEWAQKDADGNAQITIAEDGSVAGSPPATAASAAPEQKTADANGGQKVTFHFTAPDASAVYVAGDFNTWGENKGGAVSKSEAAMTKGEGGVWEKEMTLTPGPHSYKFVVDGNRWENDPNAPEKDAQGNSVIEVK